MTDVEFIRGQHIKSGDTLPELRLKLLERGDAFNLSGYDVSLKLKQANSDMVSVDTTATVEDSSRGIVSYEWESAEQTAETGTYLLECVATDASSDEELTFPNSGYVNLYIEERL